MKMRTNYFTSKGKALLRSLLLFVSVFAAQMVSAQSYDSGSLKYYIFASGGYAQVSGLSGVGLLATSITIPATITYNGTTYPVTRIANSAFANKTSLQKVTYRTTNLNTIGDGAFSGCTNLSMFASGDRPENENRILIIDGITSIGVGAFDNCPMLTELVIRNGNDNKTTKDAFGPNSNVTTAKIYGTVPGELFEGCTSLQSVSILNPDYTPVLESFTVDTYAFKGCTNLKSVTFDSKINSIGSSSFEGSGLTSVTIPATMTSVGYRAFCDCKSLTTAVVNSSNIANWAFAQCETLSNLTLNNTKTIGERAFLTCNSLSKIELPEGVTTIGDYAFYRVDMQYNLISLPKTLSAESGLHWFAGNAKINKLVVNSNSCASTPNFINNVLGTRNIKTIELVCSAVVDSWCKGVTELQELIYDKATATIGENAFAGCTGLKSINMTVSSIGSNAFSGCTGLKSLNLTAKSIGSSAFFGCTGITTAAIESPTIETFAFAGCTSMQTLTVKASTKLGFGAFSGCSALTETRLTAMPTQSAPCFQGCGGQVFVEPSARYLSAFSSATSPFYGSDFSMATTSCYAKSLFTGCTKLKNLWLKDASTDWYGNIIDDCPNVSHVGLTGSSDPSLCIDKSDCIYYIKDKKKMILIVPPARRRVILSNDYSNTFVAYSLTQYHGIIDATNLTRTFYIANDLLKYEATVHCNPYLDAGFKTYFAEEDIIVEPDFGLRGDVNADGRVSVADVTSLVDILQKQ